MLFEFLSSTSPSPTQTPPQHHQAHSAPAPSAAKLPMDSSPPPKPLHNFPLQNFKWSLNHSTSHRSRNHRSPDSGPDHRLTKSHPPPPPPPSSLNPNPDRNRKLIPKLKPISKPSSISSSSSSSKPCPTRNPNSKASPKPNPKPNSDEKSKLLIRIRTKNKPSLDTTDKHVPPPPPPPPSHSDDRTKIIPEPDDADDEPLTKTWNLRPRRFLTKPPPPPPTASNGSANGNGGALKIGGPSPRPQDSKPQESKPLRTPPRPSDPSRPRTANDANKATDKKGKEKQKQKEKEKPAMFSISLTKAEIEEDIYSLTGAKPARRPMKRAKHVQKQLDGLFPGMWLDSISPDSYRVPEAPSRPRI